MEHYGLLRLFHILGAVLMGAGLIGVWMADLRSRQLRELAPFAEAVRNIAVFYDGFVVPGALHGGHAEFGTPARSKPAGRHAAKRHLITLETGTGSRCNPAPSPKGFGHPLPQVLSWQNNSSLTSIREATTIYSLSLPFC